MCRISRKTRPLNQSTSVSYILNKKLQNGLKRTLFNSLINKKLKLRITNNNSDASKITQKKKVKKSLFSSLRRRNLVPSKPCPRREPSVIDMLNVIGEREKSNTKLSNTDLGNYVERTPADSTKLKINNLINLIVS